MSGGWHLAVWPVDGRAVPVLRPCTVYHPQYGLHYSYRGQEQYKQVPGSLCLAFTQVWPKAPTKHACGSLQHGPLHVLLIPLPGPSSHSVQILWLSKHPQEGPCQAVGDLLEPLLGLRYFLGFGCLKGQTLVKSFPALHLLRGLRQFSLHGAQGIRRHGIGCLG